MIDVYPRPEPRKDLTLRRKEILRILGVEISGEDVERVLRGLGFQTERRGAQGWRVSPPTFRLDVSREIDLIEEVARHFGYDRLPARVRPAPPRLEKDLARDKIMAVSSRLTALGYHEIIAPAMVDPAENERFANSRPVMLANPLSQDTSAMRASAVPSMISAIRWNLDRDIADVRLFEIGKTYNLRADGAPEERWVLTLGATGHIRAASVFDHEKPFDFFDLKGDLEIVCAAFELPRLSFEPSGCAYHEEGLCGRLTSQGVGLAVFGQLRRELAQEYKLRQPVWVAEIDLERLREFSLVSQHFQPLSKFPAVERDFSLVIPEKVAYAQVSAAIVGAGVEEIKGFRPVDLVDRSRVATLPAGHYSLLLRVNLQSLTRTLTSEEVSLLSERILAALAPARRRFQRSAD
jgi:phenylalanyl-tRNA synthetase beta chain